MADKVKPQNENKQEYTLDDLLKGMEDFKSKLVGAVSDMLPEDFKGVGSEAKYRAYAAILGGNVEDQLFLQAAHYHHNLSEAIVELGGERPDPVYYSNEFIIAKSELTEDNTLRIIIEKGPIFSAEK